MKRLNQGTAIVEWALCLPVLTAVMTLLFGFLFVLLRQIQLEDLSFRVADALARSDSPDSRSLEQQAVALVQRYDPSISSVRLDRHEVAERLHVGVERAPRIEIVGVEIRRSVGGGSNVELRAYSRAARVR